MASEIIFSPMAMFGLLWLVLFIGLLALVLVIIWIYSIFHCLFSRLRAIEKLMWLIVLLIFNIIGTAFYFIFSNYGGTRMAKKQKFKGKRLTRSNTNRVLGGVCGGLGEYFNVDPTIIRLIWIVLVFFSFGAAILAYIIAWIIVPEK